MQNLPGIICRSAQRCSRTCINKWAAGAFYGKVLLFTKDFATAKTVLTDVVANGKNSLGVAYDLNANYDDNFNVATDNSKNLYLHSRHLHRIMLVQEMVTGAIS